MGRYVKHFNEIDSASLPDVGGKGANLGEMSRVGFPVPRGFCVTTSAYREFAAAGRKMEELLYALDRLRPDHMDEIGRLGERIRKHLLSIDIPSHIKSEIIDSWKTLGEDWEYAVRSSATAEDLPTASFAGQQDTYLNVIGADQLLSAVKSCWASLFTDRSIVYRASIGFDHRTVLLSVIVQRMVFPEVSGIMFTADPVTGNRKIVSIDASFGLGEALVSGIVSADLYQVKNDTVVKKRIARKDVAIHADPGGGTARIKIEEERRTAPSLSDEQAVRLARTGRKIEEHFGSPQDIEWCLAGGEEYILQSRPITTLYPVPPAADDRIHLFVSLGHMQMMTDAMKPLGISALRTLIPVSRDQRGKECGLLAEAGSRLYFDTAPLLEYPRSRKVFPQILMNADVMISRAVQEFIGREEFQESLGPGKNVDLALVKKSFPTAFSILRNVLYREDFPAIDEMNRFISGRVKETADKLQEVTGPDKIERIQEILPTLLPSLIPTITQYLGAAMITYMLIKRLSRKWLGDTAELGLIGRSPPGNVTTEMGLALGDVADAARDHPAVVEYLERADDSSFFEGLRNVPGGEKVLPVFLGFFEQYGMRGTGEIDLTRPRWRESPTQLVPAILSHIKCVRPGQHRIDFQAGQVEAEMAVERLLDRLRQTPRGYFRAKRMQHLIKVHRSLIGIREHPKYFVIQNLDIVKRAVLREASELAAIGVLERPEDIFWFSLSEIKEIIETQKADRGVIEARIEKYKNEQKLTPPRAITSEGEIITARPDAHVPPGALAGSPVSAGTVEGRARVIRRLEEAVMDKGDILVAPYTDPGWTPLFPLAAGLVTEVGGLMTHGAVVAREYGIPAVVGVENATSLIHDGQWIRVDGSQGFVEVTACSTHD